MAEKKKSNLQHALTERAELQKLTDAVINCAKIVNQAMENYHSTKYVTTANIPTNVDSMNKVLSRFYEQHKIADLFALVDKNSNLLGDAISFVKTPGKGESRAEYSSALSALKTIRDNLEYYREFETGKTTISLSSVSVDSNKDGFKNYFEIAQNIVKFNEAYSSLIEYTNGGQLDYDKLPASVQDLKQIQLAISAPGESSNSQTSGSGNSQSSDTLNSFEIGGEFYTHLLNEHTRQSLIQNITETKYMCYKKPIEHRLKYNECALNENNKNIDLSCNKHQKAYEISRDNCNSHFPMVTLSDAVIDEMFDKLEKMHITRNEEGQSMLDLSSSKSAIQDYVEVGNYHLNAILPSIEGSEDLKNSDAMKHHLENLSNITNLFGLSSQNLLEAQQD